ncbi:MAG: PaaI family thioesterase [Eubacterium sp.]|nr:PaaI family thioesterase [Eubacterium sp.]
MTNQSFEKIKRYRNSYHGASEYIGIKILDVNEGWAKAELEIKPYHLNPIGSVHGGVLFALADSVGGAAAWSRGQLVTTSNGSIEYLNAGRGAKKIFAEASELKAGKNLLTYDVKITNEENKLLCHVTLQYFSLHRSLEDRLKELEEE